MGLLFFGNAFAQVEGEKPCSSEEFAQFDFWVGEWDLSWEGGEGVNRVSTILGGCVVQEEFDGSPSTPLIGKSVSTFNKQLGKWQQTWVDNNGAYLDFVGGMEGGRMVLQREAVREGKAFLQRMVFYNISADALDWNWERSVDGGESWQVQWQIHYARKP